MVNMTQPWSMLLPELGKRHGFMESAKAIAKATPIAFKVVKAMGQEGIALGARRAPDAVITETALKKAGLSQADVDFVLRAANRSNIDVGGASRELGRVADPTRENAADMPLRYAAAMGMYSETLNRLIAALAARDMLLKKNPNATQEQIDEYVDTTVTESMLNYNSTNTARAFGKQGALGQYTPMSTAFMQYSFQVLEKFYREMHTAFTKDASPEEKTAARRFLAGHATAMMVMAGSLGLPFASVVARMIEALKETFDGEDEPYDARASWRNFLADTFGPEVAEVMSRGVFRLANIEVSNRIGEADILPLSRFLTDRRKLEDRLKDLTNNMAGAPWSMASNVMLMLRDFSDGEIRRGLGQGLPLGMRGPFNAFQMTQKGYTDRRSGQALPMSVEAQDILAQALGFQPAEVGEYNEARRAQQVRQGELREMSSTFRRQIVTAMERGDAEGAREGMQRVQRFDINNPAYAVLPTLGATLQQRATARAMADVTGTPVGTNPRDRGAPGLTNWANY